MSVSKNLPRTEIPRPYLTIFDNKKHSDFMTALNSSDEDIKSRQLVSS